VGKGNKDIVLASVFDGHNDTHVLSELLSKTLHATLARNLGIQRQRQDAIMDDATRIETVKSLIIET
jgi:serine/threonine protein phosphatase PrpC